MDARHARIALIACIAAAVMAGGPAFGAPTIAYPPTVTAAAGVTLTITPGIVADGPVNATVSPPLPSGLFLDQATGVVSGVPLSASSGTHTVTVADRTGAATATMRLEIAAGAPALVYPSVVRGRVGGSLRISPGLRVVGAPRFSIAPDLPPGLSFDTATGEISGTPTGPLARSIFVALMRDDAGPHVATFELEILATQPTVQVAGSPVVTVGGGARVPQLPRFPTRASGNTLVATPIRAAAVRRAFTSRAAVIVRIGAGRPRIVRVAEAARIGGTLRLRIVLPGRARITGWVDASAMRLQVISQRRWDAIARSG